MTDVYDIAREMERLFEAGKSEDEIIAGAQRAFPLAKPLDLARACSILLPEDVTIMDGVAEVSRWKAAMIKLEGKRR